MKLYNGFHFGLEQEFFLLAEHPDNENIVFDVPPPGCPRDNAGWLVEARGAPHRDPIDAVFSLKADIERIEIVHCKRRWEGNIAKALVRNRYLWCAERQKIPLSVKNVCIRRYGLPAKDKAITNLYGLDFPEEYLEWDYAGIHINISKMFQRNINSDPITQMFDYVPIVRFLDERFKEEIKKADRLKGSYSIKDVIGGPALEYRSLPTTVDLDEVAIALIDMKKELNL